MYESIRTLPFPQLATVLGIDMARFRRQGENWQGYCPIHQSKGNNSFSYHDNGVFHCFSCKAKGKGAIDLTKLLRQGNFTAAVEILQVVHQPNALNGSSDKQTNPQPQGQYSPPQQSTGNTEEGLQLKPFKGSYEKFKQPCEWLTNRIPCEDTLNRFKVFYYDNPARKSAYSKKVMLAILGTDGETYGYLARSIHGEDVKYQFPTGFPKHKFLWGGYQVLQLPPEQRRVVYLVESPFCVMKFACYGLPAVSPFGWSLSDEQLHTLASLCRGVVYIPDRNKQTESSAVVQRIAARLWVKSPLLPEGFDDPEQLTHQQILSL